MALSTNTSTLKNYDITKPDQAKYFVFALSNLLSSAFNSIGISSFLNGAGLLNASSLVPGSLLETNLQTSLTDLGTVSGASSTIDTKSSSQVFVRVSYTGATAYSITLNNLAQGAVLYLRIANNAAAARTITIAANTPASVAYTVTLFVPGTNLLSGGVSVTNGQAINGFGMAATVGGVAVVDLVGSIG
jgi:hypothetical protein